MAPNVPKTMKQWNVTGTDGFDSLKLSEAPVPECGDKEVLVRIHAASLNYRDVAIPKGQYPFPVIDNVVPGSDGAGTVVAVGKGVYRFKPGDKVLTLFHQHYLGGDLHPSALGAALGGNAHGVLREYAAFDENGLAAMPEGLSFHEASTLPCAALTAWNSLYGLKKLLPGQWVLTQGTGGVSLFAVQFAKAAGAKVIATTSSADKAKMLEKLGADHIINYADEPEWGAKAKELAGGVGVHHILEVAGPKSMAQSIKAIRPDGIVSIIGFVGGFTKDTPGFLDCLQNLFTARGVFVGNRVQLEEMVAAIEANVEKLRPVIDPKKFGINDLKEACQYMADSKHQGKLVIDLA